MKKEGEGGSLKSDVLRIEKLVKDKTSLQRHLKITRHNNAVLKNMVEELETKNEETEVHLQETKAKIENGNSEKAALKKQNGELNLKVEKLEDERDAEKEKNIQCQSKIISYMETIHELQSKQSKMTTDLGDCKTTDADLVISNKELKECNEELEIEVKKV